MHWARNNNSKFKSIMVEYLINELSKRLEIEDMKYINWEKTREL